MSNLDCADRPRWSGWVRESELWLVIEPRWRISVERLTPFPQIWTWRFERRDCPADYLPVACGDVSSRARGVLVARAAATAYEAVLHEPRNPACIREQSICGAEVEISDRYVDLALSKSSGEVTR